MANWLLVEDEVDIRNIVKVMFQVWGHQTIEFSNGNDAFDFLDDVDEQLIGNDELPSLALMDIRMPGPNGNEIANRIRRTDRLKHIPIVLMTAFQLSEAHQKEFQERDGVDRIIFKPLPDFDKFHALLQEVIAEKSTQQSAEKSAQQSAEKSTQQSAQQSSPDANNP